MTPGGLWMADFRDGVLWRYEPRSGQLEKVTSNGEPRDLAALGSKVYVAADGRFLSGVVSRYDAVTGVREDGIDLLACAIASGEGVLWTAGCPFVQRLSTGDERLRKLQEVFLPFRTPGRVENGRVQFRELAVGEGSVWVLGDALDRRMWQLDARTGAVQRVRVLDFPPTSVAVGGGLVWVTDGRGDRVVPSRPTTVTRFRRFPSAAARPASRSAPAVSGWRTRWTGRSRGSIRPRAARWRRSTWAGCRVASRWRATRCG